MNIMAIIPARGGSKGIPRKNLQKVCGKPLIAHSIETALNAKLVRRVCVSTDDLEIAVTAKKYGAEAIMRPAEISDDLSSSESALLHVLEYLKETENYVSDLFVFLQCTSPLTLPQDIDKTIEILKEDSADSALAVTPFHYFLWHRDQNGNAVGINHNKTTRPLRHQCGNQYLESGAIYVMKTKGFLNVKHRFFGKTAMYVMPPERCWEIDDPVDLKIVELLMQERQKK